jgi:hypothetical protein
VAPYAQILRPAKSVKRSYFNVNSYAFGPALYGGKYQAQGHRQDDANLDRE